MTNNLTLIKQVFVELLTLQYFFRGVGRFLQALKICKEFYSHYQLT